MWPDGPGLGIVTGNPGVFQGYPYPYPPKTRTRAQGTGFHGYGYGLPPGQRVRKPVQRVECFRNIYIRHKMRGPDQV